MIPLRVSNLCKRFSSRSSFFGKKQFFTAVDTISFTLQPGEILGFLGPNGAGKTTTIQMLLGTLAPTSGTIEYFGKNFLKQRAASAQKITSSSGYDKLPGRLSVYDNLSIIARLYGLSASERIERVAAMIKQFDLTALAHKQVGMLSAGQSTRVMLAKAFLPDPEIVLLDEPTAALDPDVAQEVRAFVLERRKEHGTSFLFTSHNMDEVTELCDRVLIIKQGKIVADNTPQELTKTITTSHVHLLISAGLEALKKYCAEHSVVYEQDEDDIELELEEKMIGRVLVDLVKLGVEYTQISIDKPTLEDYFLTVVTDK